jgi:hypothetical protein
MKLHLIIKKGVSKKRAPIGAAVFHALSNKKKNLTLCRTMVEFLGGDVCRTLILRKTRNKFLNYWISIAVNGRKTLITMSKKGFPIKNHSVSERAELGLSPHAFISISIFLTKIDFFEGGGP